ncbi:MAG: methanol dehydrogenase [cytochrome c] subunit [Paracoccus sp. (in: a-proteobacteria)]|uniref:methanol dehydrogenase [cytochrome c] subunit n=1 Tax=Paracoccus sp. TaxID=267 RepID=UPI0026DF64F0|nr:methanol dehydrogenase [cytochrome c] subunit [Paracoccus sp. (in: a-proteobacteria)]MDO5622740.1 methanol dehydrogenase [cytochrome c] subunit [Paracoccus sp. (in: a-proteobacteria)]
MKLIALGVVVAMSLAAPALAYDGTNCRAPGNCWEPKPDYPERVEGSEYDPQHDPAELSKQGESLAAMDNRNAWRVWHMAQTGSFEYDVTKIPGYEEGGTPPAQ